LEQAEQANCAGISCGNNCVSLENLVHEIYVASVSFMHDGQRAQLKIICKIISPFALEVTAANSLDWIEVERTAS
jgi:hypothetical protein